MSGDNTRREKSGRKRVRLLKKVIVLTFALVVLTPFVMCTVLFYEMRGLNKKIEALSADMEIMRGQTRLSQDRLQELTLNTQTSGSGSRQENDSGREMTPYDLVTGDYASGESASDTDGDETQDSADGITAAHKVYLTFDDGPSSNTEAILDILDEYDVKATFFVVGKEGEWAREALVDIVKRGHTLGMHSYTHKYKDIYASVEDFAEDFVKLREYLEDVTGVISDVYRFPGGSSNTISEIDMREFAEYLDSWGVRFFDWNAASGDGGRQTLSVDELTENALKGIESRETTVILMHDAAGKPSTVDALPGIIERILAMEDTVILPITDETETVQHIHMDKDE